MAISSKTAFSDHKKYGEMAEILAGINFNFNPN